MIQQAILFTRDNASFITDAPIVGYTTPDDLLEDYDYMLNQHGTVVLAIDILEDGAVNLSYVVTESMFQANNPGINLNQNTFTTVRKF